MQRSFYYQHNSRVQLLWTRICLNSYFFRVIFFTLCTHKYAIFDGGIFLIRDVFVCGRRPKTQELLELLLFLDFLFELCYINFHHLDTRSFFSLSLLPPPLSLLSYSSLSCSSLSLPMFILHASTYLPTYLLTLTMAKTV